MRTRILVVAALLACLASLVAVSIGVSDARSGIQTVGRRTGPLAVSTSNMYFAPADTDAQVANVLLVAHQSNLASIRQQSLQTYDTRRAEVSQYLQETAAVAGADPAAGKDMRSMLDGLGQYQSLVAQAMLIEDDSAALPGRPPARALGLYRQASDLMQQQILPTARNLSKANADILNRSYEDSRSSVLAARNWVGIFGALAILTLVVTHIHLSRRHHRFLSPALLGTTLAMATLVGLSLGLLSSEAEHLRVAKKDAVRLDLRADPGSGGEL